MERSMRERDPIFQHGSSTRTRTHVLMLNYENMRPRACTFCQVNVTPNKPPHCVGHGWSMCETGLLSAFRHEVSRMKIYGSHPHALFHESAPTVCIRCLFIRYLAKKRRRRLTNMGLFPRSAEVHVRVEQPALSPGDTVTGVVTLEVLQAIDVRDLFITLEGKEHLKWGDKRGTHYSTYHNYHDLFSLSTRCQVHATLTPGETSYPFALQLPHGIPSSFEYNNGGVGHLDWVEVYTEYTVTAEVIRNGSFTWSLTGSAALTIQPTAESLSVFLDSKPASASASQIVSAMGLFERGQCHARIDMRSDVIPLESEIKLTAFVDNESTQKIKDVRVILYEDCVIDQEPTSGKRIERGTRKVRERKMPPEHVNGIVNGKPIALALTLSEKMPPSMSSHFIQSLSYRLAVEVSLSLSSRVKVDVPVRVVHKGHMGISSATTKLQCLG